MKFNDLISVLEGYKDTIKILGQIEVPIEVYNDGTEVYKTKDGFRYEYANGDVEYIRDRKYHRTDGPAIEWVNGGKAWFVNGKRMSEEQFNAWRAKNNPVKEGYKDTIKILGQMEVPIRISDYGTEVYKTKEGFRYEYTNGNKVWFNINNDLHRTDGPAVERADGSKEWYINNERHRIDGPAVEYADGSKYWYIDDQEMTEERFNKWRAENNPVKEGYKDTIKILGKIEVPIKVNVFGTEIYKTKEGYRYEFANGDIEYIAGKDEYHRTDGPAIERANGYKKWYINGKRHRTDGPAVEHENGYKEWYIDGIQMTEKQFNAWRAENNPVKEGYKETIKILGQMEVPIEVRDDGTEIYKTKEGYRYEWADGNKIWFNINNEFHRTDGPAVERAYGSKEWFVNGERHRTDGPAIEYVNGYKVWYVNGKHHREDGPAVENIDGTKEWYINDKYMTEKQFNAWRAKNNPT